MVPLFKGDAVTAERSPVVYIKNDFFIKTARENWWHSVALPMEAFDQNSWFSSLSVFKFVTVTAPARADAPTSNKHAISQPRFFRIL